MANPRLQLLSRTLYDADGVTTVWDFNFSGGYILQDHVKAHYDLNGLRTYITVTPAMLIGEWQLQIVPAVPAGALLTIYRATPKDNPMVDFVDRGSVSEVALDTVARQAIFVAAEASDDTATANVDVALAAATLANDGAVSASASATAAATSAASAAASAATSVSAVVAGASAMLVTDGSSGSLFTTVQTAFNWVRAKFTTLASSTGSTLVGFLQSGAGAVPRTTQDKLRESVSVKDFGAVGNGTEDDTAAIQAAINYLSTRGGVLFVPIGVYKLSSTITLMPKVSICGEHTGTWGTPGVVFRKAFTSGPVFYSPGSQNIQAVRYENFYIEGNKGGIGGSSGNGIEIQLCSDIIFRKVLVKELPSNGFVIGNGSASYHIKFYNCYAYFCNGSGYRINADWAHLVDCWADGNYRGIEFPSGGAGSNSRIHRCHFEEWQNAAIYIGSTPGAGGNGEHRITESVFFSRPYNAGDAAHCIFLDSSASAAGASSNRIVGNRFVYQSTYGPTKSGKYAIHLFGGGGGNNIIAENNIGGFGIGVNVAAGSVRNTLRGNYIDFCDLGVNNAAASTNIAENVFANNTNDLTDTGTVAQVVSNYFTVAPTLQASDFTSNNNLGDSGAWTPQLMFGGASTGVTYSNRVGRYFKTGKMVTCFVNITLSAKGSATGTAELSLPIAAANAQVPCMVWIFQGGSGITAPCFGFVNPASGRFTLLQGVGSSFLTDANFTSTTGLIAQITYESI